MSVIRAWTIGSDPASDLVIENPFVSGTHCRLIHTTEGYWLEDLGATNGTFVNGQRISAATPVTRTDQITLGRNAALPWPDDPSLAAPPGANGGARVLRIGREPDNDIVLDYAMISGHHAQLTISPSGNVLKDLGSTNGVAIDSPDNRVSATTLMGNETVYFGSMAIPAAQLLQWPAASQPQPAAPANGPILGSLADQPSGQPQFIPLEAPVETIPSLTGESPTLSSRRRSGNTPLWIGGGVAAVLIAGLTIALIASRNSDSGGSGQTPVVAQNDQPGISNGNGAPGSGGTGNPGQSPGAGTNGGVNPGGQTFAGNTGQGNGGQFNPNQPGNGQINPGQNFPGQGFPGQNGNQFTNNQGAGGRPGFPFPNGFDPRRGGNGRNVRPPQEPPKPTRPIDTAPWAGAEFVLVNPRSFAVGVRRGRSGGFSVVAKSSPPAGGSPAADAAPVSKEPTSEIPAPTAIKVAQDAGIPIIARNKQLTRDVFSQHKIGEEIEQQLTGKIEQYWKPYRFVPPLPQEEADFVAFKDLETGRFRIGFFLGTEGDELKYHTVSRQSDTIPKFKILPGTARRASGKRILDALRSTDFLDFSVLNVAQKVATPENKPGYVSVAVYVDVDALAEEKWLSETPDIRPTDEFFEYIARMKGQPYRRDTRKEPVRLLREAAMYLEDELISKLTDMGIPVVEREEAEALIAERQLAGHPEFEARQYGRMLCATHMVILEVKKPQSAGPYHLSIRLDDVNSGLVIWSAQRDRLVEPLADANQYVLASGQLAVAKPETKTQPFQPLESPPRVPIWRLGAAPVHEHLVMVESAPDADPIQYRPLFSQEVRSIPADALNLQMLRPTDSKAVPEESIFRYLVWWLGQNTLPLAGTIKSIEGDQAIINIGKAAGIKPGEHLRVVRPGKDGGVESLLSTSLTISQVHASHCTAFISKSGFEDFWPDLTSLQPDDLAIASKAQTRRLGLLSIGFDQPSSKESIVLGIRTRADAQAVLVDLQRSAEQVHEGFLSGCRSLGMPVVVVEDDKAAAAEGASHVISGKIRLSKSKRRYIVDLVIRPVGSKQIVNHVEFETTYGFLNSGP